MQHGFNTNPEILCAFQRTAALFIQHIDLENIITQKQTERLNRFSENQSFAFAVQIFGHLYPYFVSPTFFTLAQLAQPEKSDLGKPFMQALYQSENWNHTGKYQLHFLMQPSSVLITEIYFPDSATTQTISLITFSQTLTYTGNKPYIILTLFATEKQFATQNPKKNKAEENHFNFIMNLSPCQYDVFPLMQQNLTNRDISQILNLSIHTIKSHKAAIRKQQKG